MCTLRSRESIRKDYLRNVWQGVVIHEQEAAVMKRFAYQVGLLGRYIITTVLVIGTVFGVLVMVVKCHG